MLDRFSWRHESLSGILYKETRPGTTQVVDTHRTSSRCVWPRGIGALNSSPHSWIFTSVSVGSVLGSYVFTSTTGWIVFTLHRSRLQNLSDIWRSAFEIGVRSSQKLRHHNRSCVWTDALNAWTQPALFFDLLYEYLICNNLVADTLHDFRPMHFTLIASLKLLRTGT